MSENKTGLLWCQWKLLESPGNFLGVEDFLGELIL